MNPRETETETETPTRPETETDLSVLKGHDSSMCKRRTRFDLNEIHHRRGMCVFNRNERNEIKKWFLKMKRARGRRREKINAPARVSDVPENIRRANERPRNACIGRVD